MPLTPIVRFPRAAATRQRGWLAFPRMSFSSGASPALSALACIVSCALLVVGYGAITALAAEDHELRGQGIDVLVLHRGAGRLSLIERAAVPVAPARYLLHQCLVPLVEGRELASPAACFRVMAVAPAVLRENAPEPVELAMFPEQVLPAQERWRQVPDPHNQPFQSR